MALFDNLAAVDGQHYNEVRLVLGDQLNASHSWFKTARPQTLYLLMEMQQETDYVVHHRQKVLGFFAAMRAFVKAISANHEVLYLQLDSADNEQQLTQNLRKIITHVSASHFIYQAPDEWRLDQQLAEFSSDQVTKTMVDTEHFYTDRDALRAHFDDDKKVLMETFYRRIRKQTGYLMDGDQPEGGSWNYDQDNRNKLPDKVEIPEPLCFDNDLRDIDAMLQDCNVKTLGQADAEHFPWPITRKQSRALLEHFLAHGLAQFGRYQDSLSERGWSLFHSRLSFSMNTKMLSPKEVVERAIEAYQQADSKIGIAQIEGFIRQIIGWREFIRAIYWAKMPSYADANKLNHQGALPSYYWDGNTKMRCMQHAINQSLEFSYAHHIQRLMVTGNFALLAGVHPDAVDAWYLGIYIDAIEWVELPNTRGMSQYADGGILATKPYVSGGNYINKMGHYCKNCHYSVTTKHGDKACPFNVLYWNFLEKHQAEFANNQRMAMMYRNWENRDDAERQAILAQAKDYLARLDSL